MNSKFLYAATVAISLISTFAMADEAAPLTRAQVNTELSRAIASGTLQRTDYDFDRRDAAALSIKSRAQVAVELADAKTARKALLAPDRSASYNPFGTEILKTSLLTRAEVKADVLAAAADGTLQRTDYDDAALVARRANGHTAAPKLAQRVKAALARSKQG